MLEGGYIRLYRSILNWEWYGDIHTKTLFFHLLLTVNYEDRAWRGIVVRRGQRVCSYAALAEETRLSVQAVRTALKHLRATGEIAYEATNQYGLVTVLNYDRFQRPTGKRQAADSRSADGQQQWKPGEESKKERRRETGARQANQPLPPGFEAFWRAYPKKKSKGEALRAWRELAPDGALAGRITAAAERAACCRDWQREDGRYIPHPATWLRRMGYEDELPDQASGAGDEEDSL